MKPTAVVLALAAACLGVGSLVQGETVSLTVLYTNDLHVHLERLASLSGLIAAERASGSPVLLLDAGDAWQDFRRPVAAVWGGAELAAWMTDAGYDGMAIGNHELYLGAERLAEISSQTGFPLLAANLTSHGIEPPFASQAWVERAGLGILLIGLVTADNYPALEYPWLDFEDPEAALARILSGDEAAAADLVIVLAHLPVDEAARIALRVPGVDIFVTGHSHERTTEPVWAGRTAIVQSGEFGETLGRLLVEVDRESGEVVKAQNSLLLTEEAPVALDRGYLALFRILFGVAALALFLLF